MKFTWFTEDFKINSRKLALMIMLYSTSFFWYYVFDPMILHNMLAGLGVDHVWSYVGDILFYISTICFLFIGGAFSDRVDRQKLLLFWIVLGMISTCMTLIIWDLYSFLAISVFTGAIYGLGLPYCLAFIVENTFVEERARVFGVSVLITYILLATYLLFDLGVLENVVFIVLIRSVGLPALSLKPPDRREVVRKKAWASTVKTRNFLLYFFPWLMFNVAFGISELLASWVEKYLDMSIIMTGKIFLYLGTSSLAVVSGIVADRFGRRNTIILGLMTLGIGYAFLGLSTSPASYLVVLAALGIAYGIIMVNYLTVLGDLASQRDLEKFYAIGMAVPLIVMVVVLVYKSTILTLNVNIVSAVLSMTLFISVFPLSYATETLPEDKIHSRRFREYLEKARRLIKREEE